MSFLTKPSRFRSDNTLFFPLQNVLGKQGSFMYFPLYCNHVIVFFILGDIPAPKNAALKQKIIFRPSAVEIVFYFSH